MNIVVTGSSGFIGSHLVNFLKKKNHNVVGFNRKNSNLLNLSALKKKLKGAEYVFHMAADMGGVGYFSQEQYEPFIKNLKIDINVIEACKDNNIPLFYPSSACAFPTHLQTAKGLAENTLIPANPDQMYGWEKLVITLLSEHVSKMRVGILHTIYGEGQLWKGKKAKFPPSIMYKTLKLKLHNQPIEIWGDGTQLRTFLHIQDALEKIYEVAFSKKYQGPVNISSDEVVSITECAKIACEIAQVKPIFRYNSSKPVGVLFRGADTTKFKSLYKYHDQVSLREGFQKLHDWMLPLVRDEA